MSRIKLSLIETIIQIFVEESREENIILHRNKSLLFEETQRKWFVQKNLYDSKNCTRSLRKQKRYIHN